MSKLTHIRVEATFVVSIAEHPDFCQALATFLTKMNDDVDSQIREFAVWTDDSES